MNYIGVIIFPIKKNKCFEFFAGENPKFLVEAPFSPKKSGLLSARTPRISCCVCCVWIRAGPPRGSAFRPTRRAGGIWRRWGEDLGMVPSGYLT